VTDFSPDEKRVREAAEALGEHFDAVIIFATRYESELASGTIRVSHGTGNWYARYGQVREWIVRE
jgi:hypothetical protein